MWLKQSTAVTIKMGPFLDDTDGKTAETGLSIAQADIRLTKNGGAFAQSNNATGGTHDENGYYGIPLNTTDTNTVGTLRVTIYKSGALPVWQDFMVVPANIWDSFFGGTDYLETDITQWKGATAPAMTGDAYARLGAPAGASIAADIAALPPASDWTAARAAKLDNLDVLISSRAAASTALSNATWTDAKAGYITGDAYARLGAPAGASIAADIAALPPASDWTSARAAKLDYLTGDAYVRLGAPAGASIAADIAALPTAAGNADAVWDEAISGHLGAGSTGEKLNAAASAGDPWSTSLPGAYGAGTAGKIVGDYLTGDIYARLGAPAGASIAADIAALPTAAGIADAVWDEAISGHLGAGSTGEKLNSAASAGDPWSTALPGAYGAGTAGKIVGDALDAAMSSRAAASTALTNATWTDAKAGYLTGDAYARLGAPAGASIAADIAALPPASDWTSARAAKLDNLDGTITSRAPASTALSNAVWADAKAGYLTGDAYVRLGAPAGASIAADIAALPPTSDWSSARAAKLDYLTGDSYVRLGTPAGASVSADIAELAAALPVRLTKNTAFNNFPFFMEEAATKDGATGLTITATRAIDGGSFAACANSASEIANGWYRINLAASDLNGDVIILSFDGGAGAKVRRLVIITQTG